MKLSEPFPKPFQPTVFKEALYNQQDHCNLTVGVFSCTAFGVYNFGFDTGLFSEISEDRTHKTGIQVRQKKTWAEDGYKHALAIVTASGEGKQGLAGIQAEGSRI